MTAVIICVLHRRLHKRKIKFRSSNDKTENKNTVQNGGNSCELLYCSTDDAQRSFHKLEPTTSARMFSQYSPGNKEEEKAAFASYVKVSTKLSHVPHLLYPNNDLLIQYLRKQVIHFKYEA